MRAASIDKGELLRRRAAELAKRPEDEDRRPVVELLVVVLDGRRLGLEGRHVQQIVPNQGLCRLPGDSGALTGLIAARGAAVPVADLGSLLVGSAPDLSRGLVVLIDGGSPVVGVLVDEVEAVVRVPADDIRPRPEPWSSGAAERGITPDDVVVVDTVGLLADPRLLPEPASPLGTTSAPARSNIVRESHGQHDHR